MGRIRSAARAGVAAALFALSLSACGDDVRDEAVRLADVRDAVVVSGGSERAAANGATLGKGDRVRTGRAGTATLVVRGRRVVLGGRTDVGVPDGATVELAQGALLVDRRRGPGLTLRAGDTTLDRVGAGALRVERSLTVLVAGLSAGGRVRTSTGQQLDLGPLYQVRVSGRALPRGAVPLSLRDDAWERQAIPGILADDAFLNDQAAGLDGPDAAIVPATYGPTSGVRRSVALLADAIGRAAGGDPARQRANAARARDLRAQGGSWGVVAAIVRTPAVDVAGALSAILAGTPPVTTPTPGPPVARSGPDVVAGATPTPPIGTPQPSRTPGPPSATRTTKPPRPTSPAPTTSSPSSSSLADEIGKIIPTPLVPVPLPSVGLLGL